MTPDGSGFWFWEAVVYSTPSSPAFLLLLIVSGGVVGEFGPGSSPVPLRPLLLFAFFGLTDSRSENRIGLSSPQLGSCIFALLLILKDVWVSSIGESDSLDWLRLSIFSLLKLWSNGLTHQNRCEPLLLSLLPVPVGFRWKPIILSGDDFQSVKVMMSRLGTCLFFTTRLTRGNAFEIDHYLSLDYLLFGPVWATW